MPPTSSSNQYAQNWVKSLGTRPIMGPSGPVNITVNNILEAARAVRDRQLWELYILPEAVLVYQQLASSREWAVSGKVRSAQRAVEWFNGAISRDQVTGQTFYGFQQFEQRRALDAVVVGRTAFYAPLDESSDEPLEYLDPTFLRFYRTKQFLDKTGVPEVPRPDELVWQYQYARNFRAGEIILDHLLPIGTSFFQSPIVSVLRTARLYWLLNEHDNAALDGRKIRDILLVGNEQVGDALEAAIVQQIAAWSGADPAQLGIPVVGINNPGGQPLANQIFALGLSKIPEAFQRDAFTNSFVNQVGAALGLSLRHFWNAEKGGTNRSIEEVAEIRQQQKGPNLWIKSEERTINNSGILDRFGTGRNKVRFGFIEETDLSSRVTNAEVLSKTADAALKIAQMYGTTIAMDDFLAWMQNLGVLPFEMKLQSLTDTNAQTVLPSDTNNNTQGGTTVEGNKGPTAFSEGAQTDETTAKKAIHIDYDQVTIDQDGHIVDRRFKIFSVLKVLIEEDIARHADVLPADEDAFLAAVNEANRSNVAQLQEQYSAHEAKIRQWADSQIMRTPEIANIAINKALSNEELSPVEQDVVDTVIEYLKTWTAEGAA